MSQTIQQLALAPDLEIARQDQSMTAVFERLACDPNASVEKIERLMALMERLEAKRAEAAFNEAMSDAQRDMRPIAADATNPETRSKYASYVALDRALRPIYTSHGFALSFNTGDSPKEEHVRVICVVRRGGHAEPYHVDMPSDGKGAKGGAFMTKTHATASALSYGMRYLLKMIFNVAVGEDDDDGNRAARTKPAPKAPEGYDDWLTDLEATVDEGHEALKAAWHKSPAPLRRYLTDTDGPKWEAMKRKALTVNGPTS